MGLNSLTQAERLELAFFDRIYLVHLELPGKTLYLSDRNFAYDYGSVQNYENYLFDLSSLSVDLNRIRAGLNQKLTLRFRNEQVLAVNTLIELNATYRFCFATVRIYELRVVQADETFASDVKTLVFRGVGGQPYGITRSEFKIDCSNVMLAKRARLPLQVIDTAVDANADPDDIGKIRNTVYSTVGHVPCRCVVAGAKDSLTADITSSVATITVSGDTKIAFPGTGTIQIDDEQITYTGFSSNQFTGCTRGANSTTAAGHSKGAGVAQVLSEYIYEIAKHPIKQIDAIYVDGVRQVASVTTYTGQTGSEKTGFSGRAVAVFTVLPIVKKQINLVHSDTVNDTIGVSDTIDFTAAGASRECYPSSASGGTNPTNAIDGSEVTYGTAYNNQSMTISFSQSNFGTVTKLIFWITAETGSHDIAVSSSNGTCSPSSINSGEKTTFRVTVASPTNSWNFNVILTADTGETATVYEVTASVEYTPTLTKSGSASKTGSAAGAGTLTGNSSADTVIGEQVTADVQGYKDDGSGTYTGTPNALIERPDHVFKHILIALLGEVAGDIGSSFATSGTSYGSTYKLAFIVHEIAQEADRLMQELAFQCRSKFLEFRGKFELIYLGSAPAVSHTFTEDDCLDEPLFGYTPEVDIRNRIYAKYKRDYRQFGEDAYDAVESTSDATSITNNGERPETVELSACRTLAMAQDWKAWYLTQKKQEWRTLELTVPWIGKVLGAAGTLGLTWPFYTGLTWDPESIDVDHSRERMTIRAQEWPS